MYASKYHSKRSCIAPCANSHHHIVDKKSHTIYCIQQKNGFPILYCEKDNPPIIESMTTSTMKPPYILTPVQSLMICKVLEGTDENSQKTENCLKLLLSLIDQQITSKAHECIFSSAFSILSIKDNMNFKDAREARPKFSAIRAVYRALVLFEASRISSLKS